MSLAVLPHDLLHFFSYFLGDARHVFRHLVPAPCKISIGQHLLCNLQKTLGYLHKIWILLHCPTPRDSAELSQCPMFPFPPLCLIVVHSLTHIWLFATPWTVAHQAPWDFPGKTTEVGCHFLLRVPLCLWGCKLSFLDASCKMCYTLVRVITFTMKICIWTLALTVERKTWSINTYHKQTV